MVTKVVLTGATGFVGSHSLESWAGKDNVSVLPVVRTDAQRERCKTRPCLLFSELTEAKLLGLGWRDATVIHLTGASRDYGDHSMWESIVGTTDMVSTVSRRAGARRIVYLSGYGVRADATEPYFIAKYRAEALIRASGIPHTIFRSSYVLGFEDELMPQLAAGFRRGRVEVPGSGLYRVQPLHIADVVAVLLAAARDSSEDSRVIPLLGAPIAYIDLVKSLASKVAPETTVVAVELEEYIQRILRSSDPDLSMSELGILIYDCLGPPTVNCYGRTMPDLGSVIERVANSYMMGK